MLRRQSLIALSAAVLLGLVAVYLANIFLTARQGQIAGASSGTTKVAVAAIPLSYGTQLTPDKIKFVDYPTGAMPTGTYPTAADLFSKGKQRVALRPIQVNQPLLSSDLTGEGQGASIAALLPDGMRAASVKINDVSGVAGFVKPNDTVDVLITRQAVGGAQRDVQITDVLLQNIRVVGMDQEAQAKDGPPVVSRTATLEVTPIDAQKLALGQQLGTLSLVLRKPGVGQNVPYVSTVSLRDLRYNLYGSMSPTMAMDQTTAHGPVVPIHYLARRHRSQAKIHHSAAAAKPATNRVEVMRGTASSTYEVGDNAR